MQSRRMHNALLVILALSALGHSALAQSVSSDDLARRAIERRAVEAAIWGMPIVSVDAMRQAFFRAGAQYGDVVYCSKPADWKFQTTTPNASSLYVYLNFNTKDGPVVLDIPQAIGAGLFGSVLDAWSLPVADVGRREMTRAKAANISSCRPATWGWSLAVICPSVSVPTMATHCSVPYRQHLGVGSGQGDRPREEDARLSFGEGRPAAEVSVHRYRGAALRWHRADGRQFLRCAGADGQEEQVQPRDLVAWRRLRR